jgi:hypothetical protein
MRAQGLVRFRSSIQGMLERQVHIAVYALQVREASNHWKAADEDHIISEKLSQKCSHQQPPS